MNIFPFFRPLNTSCVLGVFLQTDVTSQKTCVPFSNPLKTYWNIKVAAEFSGFTVDSADKSTIVYFLLHLLQSSYATNTSFFDTYF